MPDNMHLAHPLTHHGAPSDTADLIVYAVHGRGQSPEFMAEVADRVALPRVAWVLPRAHEGSWYPEGFLAPTSENQPHLGHALDTVRTHLEQLLGEHSAPVVVFGFSQGACLLSEYLLLDQPSLAGAVIHTGGYLGPSEQDWLTGSAEGLSGLDMQVMTARNDSWVPLHRVQATESAFRSLGVSVESTVYDDLEHHINDDAIRKIRDYLVERS